MNFFNLCLEIILSNDIEFKCDATVKLYNQIHSNDPTLSFDKTLVRSIPEPGRPDKPELVHPLEVPKRGIGTTIGHAGLFHALAHIEFNAINLALDACYRFQSMPIEYYRNWMSVAKDEVYHFSLLNEHLATLQYTYGDFTAHTGLWDMVHKTECDALVRMALVPRVLEARGIDAVPELRKKVLHIKDTKGAAILDIIHHDEITHVKYGDIWFKYLCDKRNLDYTDTFFSILEEYSAPKIRGAFNREDRKQAGFSDVELDKLLLR